MIEPYKPLFIHLNPASIPEVVAHMQKYLIEHTFVTVEEFGTQFQEYIDAHPEIIKVASVNGQEGDVLLTSTDIPMAQGSTDTVGSVIADIQEEAGTAGETLDDLVVDMDAVKSDIVTLENVFTGATEESSGTKGLVPAPANTQTSHYLKATGDFEAIPAREVVSVSITGAGTVEAALTSLYEKLNALGDSIYITEVGTLSSKITMVFVNELYYPNLHLVSLAIAFNVNTAIGGNEELFTLPAQIPGPKLTNHPILVPIINSDRTCGVNIYYNKRVVSYTTIPVGSAYRFHVVYFTE